MTTGLQSSSSGDLPPLIPIPVRTKVDREWEAEQIRQSFVQRSKRAGAKTLRTSKLKPTGPHPASP